LASVLLLDLSLRFFCLRIIYHQQMLYLRGNGSEHLLQALKLRLVGHHHAIYPSGWAINHPCQSLVSVGWMESMALCELARRSRLSNRRGERSTNRTHTRTLIMGTKPGGYTPLKCLLK